MQDFDRHGIAMRARGLIAGQDGGDVGATARRLSIDEVSLRMSIDELSPYPTLDALAAIVNHYGVDPHWLLTGEYDLHTHRAALESGMARNERTLEALLTRSALPYVIPLSKMQRH